ncbi:hypothetical protein BDZ94DRAFT_1313551 [Collybia nuda]|uniref:Uncharacterized protein n=1 Tax=Collybia nuda TaxID=64659 RepID=A0A9P5XWQ1_9AGAR|nr:hypothetical protein BDZ94DRAFT_1313551 [Collybia nuda]
MSISQGMYELSPLFARQLTNSDDDEGNSLQLIHVFISFHLFGFFGTIIMLLTACFSRTTPRHPTWISFAISWIISTFSYSLLFLGGHLTGSEPGYPLCLVQGVMIYSAPPLTAATTCALVIQIWFLVRSVATSTSSGKGHILSSMWSASLLIIPYLLYVTIVVAMLVVGIQTPSTVQRVSSGMYCNFANRIPGRISTFLVASIMIPTVFLEIQVCMALRRNWNLFKSQKGSLSMILRVVIFTLFGFFAIAASILFFFTVHHGPQLNVVISLIPIAAVLVFATQGDLIRVWMFWRKRPDDANTEDVVRPPSPDPRKSESILVIG